MLFHDFLRLVGRHRAPSASLASTLSLAALHCLKLLVTILRFPLKEGQSYMEKPRIGTSGSPSWAQILSHPSPGTANASRELSRCFEPVPIGVVTGSLNSLCISWLRVQIQVMPTVLCLNLSPTELMHSNKMVILGNKVWHGELCNSRLVEHIPTAWYIRLSGSQNC